ncbi:MAG: transcriptional repressor LexA [Anaerolineae bacterium]|nr:transcriptional repressor LexA [Anaerolineae bacterium]
MKISDKQRQMLAFIEEYVDENRYPPTIEEIRSGLNFSTKSLVTYHLSALEDASYLKRSPNKSRGIRLSNETDTVQVPFEPRNGSSNGHTANPIDMVQAIQLTGDIVSDHKNLFALRVSDESMLDASVNKGDVVIAQRKSQAADGEMVVVHLAGEGVTLLKRYRRQGKKIGLESANPDVPPITVDPDRVQVKGKVVAVIRQFR